MKTLPFCLAFLAVAAPSFAQTPPNLTPPPVAGVKPPRPTTLADLLAALPPSRLGDRVVFAVAADVMFRRSTDPLPPIGSPADAAEVFGLATSSFGGVTVLMPPTMTLLHADPSLAQIPLAELVTSSPLPFLLGTLTPDQWRKLGSDGLGFSDLNSDQQSLLQAALPSPLSVVSSSVNRASLYVGEYEKMTPEEKQAFDEKSRAAFQAYEASKRNVTDNEARGLKLHAVLDASYSFEVPGQSGYGIGVDPGNEISGYASSGTLKLTDDVRFGQEGNAAKRLTALFKGDVPNALKPADWRWENERFSAPVLLTGVKTVGELVSKCATATKLELHCPPSWAKRSVLILGARAQKPVAARDALKAVCLALRATWRRVGPAYILGEDLTPRAVMRAQISEIAKVWEKRLEDAEKQIGARMGEVGWKNLLTFAPGDPSALPPDLLKKAVAGGPGTFGTNLPLSSLPTGINSGLKSGLEANKKREDPGGSAEKILAALKPDSPVGVSLNLRFAVEIPGSGLMMLGNAYRPQTPDKPKPPDATPPALVKKAIPEVNRGVLCAPTSPAQARQIVQKLQAIGFNTLYCAAFINGRTYFPNDALPPETDAAGETLAAAIDEGTKRGVKVWASLDTLCWKRDAAATHPSAFPSGFVPDVTLTGETDPQLLARRISAGSLGKYDDAKWLTPTLGSEVWVSPADSHVRETLTGMVKALARVKNLAGIVFDKTAAGGYVETSEALDDDLLGYTPANRLAFLRAADTDPMDLGDGWGGVYIRTSDTGINLELPQQPSAENEAWKKWRSDADISLMAELFQTVKTIKPTLPRVMRERKIGFTYDAWTSAKVLNEAASLLAEGDALGKHTTPQSVRVSLFSMYRRVYPRAASDSLTDTAPGNLRTSSVVFDLLTGTENGDAVTEVEALAKMVSAPKANP